MFHYPDSLIEKIKKVWDFQIRSKEEIPQLPNNRILKQLLDVAYHASFLTEELRRVGFRIVFCSKNKLKKHHKYGGRPSTLEPVEFVEPREFNIGEILRLAPATDFTRMLICVGPEKGNKLRIWALIDAGSSWWDFTHGESSSGYPPPNFLTIASTEPGYLSISRGGGILINLRHGQMSRPTGSVFYKGPVSDYFESSKEHIYKAICEQLKTDFYDEDDHDNEYPKREYIQYIERVLFHIREKGHGGTLIIVPDYLDHKDPRLTDRVNIKYPISYNRAEGVIIDLMVKHRKYYDLLFPMWDGKVAISKEKFRTFCSIQASRKERKEDLADSVKFIASLTGVDGAVVMTDRYRLIGFGAEVTALSPSLNEVKIASEDSGETGHNVAIESFGTRHRSAFRFCSNYEDSLAFVISQDGGVKAIKRVGSVLVMWPDINLGLLGF